MVDLTDTIYKRLSSNSIRVLRLLPGAGTTPLICHIDTQLISEKPYDALSYVWGDPTPFATITCIDGSASGELGIGRGLAEALTAFRLPDKPQRIWTDALCINQKDIAERQSQVRLMGQIYGRAQHVLCWLGPFTGNCVNEKKTALLAIHFLREFNKSPHDCLLAAREHFHSCDDLIDSNDASTKSWLAIKQLFDFEYFHRAWIIQEVGLALRARFYWGNRDVWLDWTEVATFCRFLDDNGASVIAYLGLKSWVANHINLVWETDSLGKPRFNFVEVLHWARVHHSTDPRDYVYALLSHPSAKINGRLIVQPDYTLSPAQVFTEVASNIIESTSSLQIIAFVDHPEKPGDLVLPTWVPDWHGLNLTAPLRCSTQGGRDTDTSIHVSQSSKGVMLQCRGAILDTLATFSDMIEHSELTVTTLEKETKKKIPFLIDHIWRENASVEGVNIPSAGEFLTALSLVLTGGFRNELNSTRGDALLQQQSDLAALITDYERIRLNEQPGSFFASLDSEEKALIEKMAAKGSAQRFVQDMTWTSMCRRVFRTKNGSFGLGPRTMREGDICVVLFGVTYPMMIRTNDAYFELVGPVLLYGFMDGQADQLLQDGKLIERHFDII